MEKIANAPPPTLYHLESSQSLRVLWALEELADSHGQTFELKRYPRVAARADPAIKKISPMGKAPVLTLPHLDGRAAGGEVVITESRVILQFLADAYSDDAWRPATLEDRMRDRQFQEFANNSLGSVYMLMLVFELIPRQAPAFLRGLLGLFVGSVVGRIKAETETPHQVLEDALSDDKPWFSGPKMGLADFNMSWQMDVGVQRGYLDVRRYPKLAAWVERVHARPAYKRALQKTGTYDLVTFGM